MVRFRTTRLRPWSNRSNAWLLRTVANSRAPFPSIVSPFSWAEMYRRPFTRYCPLVARHAVAPAGDCCRNDCSAEVTSVAPEASPPKVWVQLGLGGAGGGAGGCGVGVAVGVGRGVAVGAGVGDPGGGKTAGSDAFESTVKTAPANRIPGASATR